MTEEDTFIEGILAGLEDFANGRYREFKTIEELITYLNEL